MCRPPKSVCVCSRNSCELRGSLKRNSKRNNYNTLPIKNIFTLIKDRKSFHHSYELPKTRKDPKWWKKKKEMETDGIDEPEVRSSTLNRSSYYEDDQNTPSPILLSYNDLNMPPEGFIELTDFDIIGNGFEERFDHTFANRPIEHNVHQIDGFPGSSSRRNSTLNKLFNLKDCFVEYFKRFKQDCSRKRIFFLILGLLLLLIGITYDILLYHLIQQTLQNCRDNLLEEYSRFGNKLINYNNIFRSTAYNGRTSYEKLEKLTRDDPKFVETLEGIELSIKLNFFSLMESNKKNVKFGDVGPLHLILKFQRNVGFRIKCDHSLSNMSFSTPFYIYDIYKMLLESNNLPYFGFHMNDYYETKPESLLKMIMNVLQKMEVDTSFLEELEEQAVSRYKRQENLDISVTHFDVTNEFNSIFLNYPPEKYDRINVPVDVIKKNLSFAYEENLVSGSLYSWKFSYDKLIEKHFSKYLSGERKLTKQQEQFYPFMFNSLDSNKKTISNSYLSNLDKVINIAPAIRYFISQFKFSGKDLSFDPFWASTPYFYTSKLDDKIVDATFVNNSNKHQSSSLYIHPILGVPINTSIAVQFGITPPPSMLHGGKLVPIFWTRIQLEKIPSNLWYLFWFVNHIRVIVMCSTIISGLVIIGLTVLLKLRKTNDTPTNV